MLVANLQKLVGVLVGAHKGFLVLGHDIGQRQVVAVVVEQGIFADNTTILTVFRQHQLPHAVLVHEFEGAANVVVGVQYGHYWIYNFLGYHQICAQWLDVRRMALVYSTLLNYQ